MEGIEKQIKTEYAIKAREKAYELQKKELEDRLSVKEVPDEAFVYKMRTHFGNDFERFERSMRFLYRPKYICQKENDRGEPRHRGDKKACEYCRESDVHKSWVKTFKACQSIFGRDKCVELYKDITTPNIVVSFEEKKQRAKKDIDKLLEER